MRSHDPHSDPSGRQNKWNLVANVSSHVDTTWNNLTDIVTSLLAGCPRVEIMVGDCVYWQTVATKRLCLLGDWLSTLKTEPGPLLPSFLPSLLPSFPPRSPGPTIYLSEPADPSPDQALRRRVSTK